MNFLLLVHLLLQILYDVGLSEAGASEISDKSDLYVKLNTRLDGQRKRLEKIINDLTQPIPAFVALLSEDLLAVSSGQKLVFPDAQVNVNGCYNESTGAFKAPTSGTYHFALTLASEGTIYPTFYADIVAGEGDKVLCSLNFTGEVGQTMTISTQVTLVAGENVWVKLGNFAMSLVGGHSSVFTGFRIQSL